jgi:hypothetical protein
MRRGRFSSYDNDKASLGKAFRKQGIDAFLPAMAQKQRENSMEQVSQFDTALGSSLALISIPLMEQEASEEDNFWNQQFIQELDFLDGPQKIQETQAERNQTQALSATSESMVVSTTNIVTDIFQQHQSDEDFGPSIHFGIRSLPAYILAGRQTSNGHQFTDMMWR